MAAEYFKNKYASQQLESCISFYNLASEITYYHFHHSLLVDREKKNSPDFKDKGYIDPSFLWKECHGHSVRGICSIGDIIAGILGK